MTDQQIARGPKKGSIYLAAPYLHTDPAVMEDRVKKTAMAAGILIGEGRPVVAPTVMGHLIDRVSPNTISYGTWIKTGLDLMFGCWSLYVLCLDGWRKSNGVKTEIYMAGQLGMPVRFCVLTDDYGGMVVRESPPEQESWFI